MHYIITLHYITGLVSTDIK